MTSATGRGTPASPAFEAGPFASLAQLYRPVDPADRFLHSDAGPGWRIGRDGLDVDVLVWGRLPAAGSPSGRSIPDAIRREKALALARLRPPRGLHVAAVHRLPPPVWRPGRLRRIVRRVLLGGLVVEFVRGRQRRRVIDEVVAAAGATALASAIRPAGDGSALARLRLGDGSLAELRVAPEGHRKDPMRGRAALVALEAGGVDRVPRPLAAGRTAGVVWSTESVMAGRHASEVSGTLLRELVELLAQLPAAPPERGSGAVGDQLAEIAAVLPAHASRLQELGGLAGAWSEDLSSVLFHGDFWLNNLLVRDGHLVGVVDWDTWHPAGVPAADLVTLLGAIEGARGGRGFGELVMASYWRSAEVTDMLRSYFALRREALPDARGMAAIATGWWAGRVFGSLYRRTRPTDDPTWVKANVADPLAWLIELGRDLR